jgi:hypothetical protein
MITAPAAMPRANDAGWRIFLGLCDAISDPDFEMTCEEWAVFYAAFDRVRRAGAPFDPAFVDTIETMARDIVGTQADSDHDDADDRLDLDDDDREPDHSDWG